MFRYTPVILLATLTSMASAQSYFLNGDATAIGNDCYQLTPALGTQNGTVWYADQISVAGSFDLEFTMNFGDLDANGADGMCFVMQTVGTNAIGESGGGMGYLNFANSFAIEFDTWQNSEYGDPVYDHIAMEVDGDINHTTPLGNIAGPVQMDALDPNVEDGEDHVVRITYDSFTGELSVYFDCQFRLSAVINFVANVFDGQWSAFWGFTGATGGAWNTQVVCLSENIIATGPDVSICTGSSTELSVAGNTAGTYIWTPSDYLDDPTSPTPVASPPVTTTYTVTFSDLCGNEQTDTITVHVEDLVVELPEVMLLTCEDPLAQISGDINFFNDLNYIWSTIDGQILNGQGTPTINTDTPGTYTLAVNYNNECFAAAQTTVEGNYQFEVDVTPSGNITCLDGTPTITADSGIPGTTYSWTTVDGNIVGSANAQTITVDAPGNYIVQAYLNEFCNGGDATDIIIDFELPSVDAGSDVVINCNNPEAELSGSTDADNAVVSWTTGDGNITGGASTLNASADEAGTYLLTVTNSENGCTSSDQVVVSADFDAPEVFIPLQDTLTCIAPSVEIEGVQPADGAYSYAWSTADGNIASGSNTSSPTVDAPGTYAVLVTNTTNGCSDSGDIEIEETDEFNLDLTSLSFPNVISVNGDSRNESWKPFLASDPEFEVTTLFSEYSLQVFNRWGKLEFENTDNRRDWQPDGQHPGTYYYICTYSTSCGTGQSGVVDGYVLLVE
ncbi:MAG: gliding motility-associated C-terminal domain-containing protein [Flavobacteriales bacterium]|nr:gliding motility-associated C-terminal domain-containing protein [Flavobacteriales bacterium]